MVESTWISLDVSRTFTHWLHSTAITSHGTQSWHFSLIGCEVESGVCWLLEWTLECFSDIISGLSEILIIAFSLQLIFETWSFLWTGTRLNIRLSKFSLISLHSRIHMFFTIIFKTWPHKGVFPLLHGVTGFWNSKASRWCVYEIYSWSIRIDCCKVNIL